MIVIQITIAIIKVLLRERMDGGDRQVGKICLHYDAPTASSLLTPHLSL